MRIYAKNECGFSDPLENEEPFKVIRPAGKLYILTNYSDSLHIVFIQLTHLQITMRKKVLKKLHMITLHPAAFPAPLRPCHPGWEKPMSMLTSNRIRNLPFCEEMNTSLGYGTMHQNCLRMIKLFCFIVVISNKFTTSLSYFLWSSAKWFFCTFDEGFPPDTSYYFFGNFVVETFLMKNLLKNRFYPFNHTLLKTILHKVSERFLALTSILMDWLLRKSHFFWNKV